MILTNNHTETEVSRRKDSLRATERMTALLKKKDKFSVLYRN